MPATREQLEARWETSEGQQLARAIRQALNRPETTGEMLQSLIASLLFTDEVAPSLDLRGLHLPAEDVERNELLFIHAHDLSGVRLNYARDVVNIVQAQMIGAVLDEMYCINGIFESDFTNVSFDRATLQGVRFGSSNLTGAHFEQARLGKADFSRTVCQGTHFVEADMRFTLCAYTDFRGADFAGANLTEASLGGITFDEQTRVQGTILYGASMDDDFRAFALQRGALLRDTDYRMPAYDLACLNALIALMQEPLYNEDGHLDVVLPYVVAHRDTLAQDPTYSWEDPLADDLRTIVPQSVIDEVFDYLYPEAMRLLAYYL